MQLKHLYRVVLTYPEGWQVPISGPQGTEVYHTVYGRGRLPRPHQWALQRHESPSLQPFVVGLHETMGEAVLKTAREQGRALTMEEAIQFAVAEPGNA